jgi:DNA-binding beta-propeller fold protein YncE
MRALRTTSWLVAGMTLVLAGCSAGNAAPTPAAVTPTIGLASVPLASQSAGPTASPLPVLTLLWEKSGPQQPDPCCQTWSPAVDPLTGNIWVADSLANSYWIFSPSGSFVESWGTAGSGPGQLDLSAHRQNPQAAGGIAFAPDGSFYVADTGNHRVQEFDAHRHLVRTWGTFGSGDGQFAEPFMVVTDGTTVYVADDDRGDVQAFDRSGRFLRAFGPTETNAGIFLAIDVKGTLYRAGGEERPTSVLRYAPDGTVAATIDTGNTDGFVAGLAVSTSGNLFANVALPGGDLGHKLEELDSSGHVVGEWSTGGETAVVDPGGKAIYLASDGNATWPTASLRKYALP